MKEQGLSEKWIKASIIGTIWAASEIVLGSFLHNLRIPFSGNILTAIALVILISFSYVWREKGLFWRAGLICALMKTISPSAVIFGPMIAIFAESLLLEISVRIIGQNLTGFALGGMLAMSWNLLQKIVNYILFYGWNIVDLYSSLLNYARKQLSISFDLVWLPLIILLVSFCLFGLVAAVIGVRAGKRIVKLPFDLNLKSTSSIKEGSTTNQNYSIGWLVADIFLMVGALLLLSFSKIIFWSVIIPVIIIIWILRYKRAMRQLSRPGFWLFFVVITMITAFIFGKLQSPEGSWMAGLIIGIQMNFRAALVITGFTVLGTEFYNPVVRNFFIRSSLRQLPLALELSFESLPLMIANIPDLKTFVKNPVLVVSKFVALAEDRLAEMKNTDKRKITTVIITGEIGSGKTTLASDLAVKLMESGIKVSGLLTVKRFSGNELAGYDVIDIASGKRKPFLSMAGVAIDDTSGSIGRFSIHKNGLNHGIEALSASLNDGSHMIILDEVGKLELEGRGWAAFLDNSDKYSGEVVVLTVRKQFLDQVISRWNMSTAIIFDPEHTDAGGLLQEVLNRMKS